MVSQVSWNHCFSSSHFSFMPSTIGLMNMLYVPTAIAIMLFTHGCSKKLENHPSKSNLAQRSENHFPKSNFSAGWLIAVVEREVVVSDIFGLGGVVGPVAPVGAVGPEAPVGAVGPDGPPFLLLVSGPIGTSGPSGSKTL